MKLDIVSQWAEFRESGDMDLAEIEDINIDTLKEAIPVLTQNLPRLLQILKKQGVNIIIRYIKKESNFIF